LLAEIFADIARRRGEKKGGGEEEKVVRGNTQSKKVRTRRGRLGKENKTNGGKGGGGGGKSYGFSLKMWPEKGMGIGGWVEEREQKGITEGGTTAGGELWADLRWEKERESRAKKPPKKI